MINHSDTGKVSRSGRTPGPGIAPTQTGDPADPGLENVEQYWIDPDSKEAKQAAQAKEQQAQQAQQAQMQAMQQQTQVQQQIFALQAQLDKYKHDTELVFKFAKERLDAEIEEAKLVGSATLDLERQQLVFENQQQAQINGTSSE